MAKAVLIFDAGYNKLIADNHTLYTENKQLRRLLRALVTHHRCSCGDIEHCITCQAKDLLGVK